MVKDLSSSPNTAMSYSSFKPKFPLDPFAVAPSTRLPWSVDADSLPSPALLQSEQRVILAIGQPTAAMLAPLFDSPHFSSSLLIIASYRLPEIPGLSRPAVATLRLRAPIAVEDTGASRLIDILEWAVQVGRLWRRTGGPHFQELMEEISASADSVKLQQSYGRTRYSVAPSPSTPTSPTGSEKHSVFSSETSLATSASVQTRRKSFRAFGRSKSQRRQSALTLHPADPEQRPFDAILNFLPADIPDKSVLKAAILVTTLTRPYLAAPPVRAPATRFWTEGSGVAPASPVTPDKKRWSLFRSSSSAVSSSTTVNVESKLDRSLSGSVAFHSLSSLSEDSNRTLVTALTRCRKSRIVHLMPSVSAKAKLLYINSAGAQARLIRSIEAFMLSFSFPVPTPSLPANDPDFIRARPYILPATALAGTLSLAPPAPKDAEDGDGDDAPQSAWTLAELILSGALDQPVADNAGGAVSEVAQGKLKEAEPTTLSNAWMAHRAWISGVSDVQVRPEAGAQTTMTARSSQSVAQAQTQAPAPARASESPPARTPQKAAHERKPVSALDKRLPTPPRDKNESEDDASGSRAPPRDPHPRSHAHGSSHRHPRALPHSQSHPVERRPSSSRRARSRSRSHSHTSPPASAHRPPSAHRKPARSDAHGLPTPPDSEEASLERAPPTREGRRPRVSGSLARTRTGSAPLLSVSRRSSRREREKERGAAPAPELAAAAVSQDRNRCEGRASEARALELEPPEPPRRERKTRRLVELSMGSDLALAGTGDAERTRLERRSSWRFWRT